MQNFYIPDLTGQNPDYRIEGETLVYYARGQILTFVQPVYFASIKIHPLNGSGDWVPGKDFTYSQVDNTATAFAKNQDPSFEKILVREIVLNGDLSGQQYQITLNYQTYTPTTGDMAINSQDGTVNFTPGVALEMLRRLQSQMQKSLLVQATVIPKDINPKLLEWDKDCLNPNNVITDEQHSVNTVNGQSVIQPTYTPFFKDGVVIKVGDRILQRDADYVLKDCDRVMTSLSSNRSGVYRLIHIITDLNSDDVKVTYHAVGGQPALRDVQSLTRQMDAMRTFLDGTQYLTNEILPDAPNFHALLSRVRELETNMRALLSGNPSYGHTTSGTAIVRSFKANDTNLHWFSLATLYKIPNNNTIIKNGEMCLHIEMPERHLSVDVTVVLDLESPHTPFKVNAENFLYDQGYSLFGNTQNVTPPAPLLFRVIYNTDSDSISGCVLQLGTVLPNLIERIGIEDRSSVEGTFQLISGDSAVAAEDNGPISLPDPTRIWSQGAAGSQALTKALPFDEGYLVFMGSLPFSQFSSNVASFASPIAQSSLLYSWFPIEQIKKLRLYYTVTDISGSSSQEVMEVPIIGLTAQFKDVYIGNGNTRGNLFVSLNQTSVFFYYNTTPAPGTTLNVNYIQAFV